ncbi:alpha-ketoacid dehydrogenase subunit beta [Nocardioides humi]|uniref:Alpha-ketoacid dehydrogenase subunit beta n=2 Tax=Nocardioides humi TaxID=449461 RepID=A0ABN2BFH6_9ACTN
MSEAIVAAISDAMTEDDTVYLMGQDIGVFGGPMQSAKGLWDTFGGQGRVIDAPISEAAMVGTAVGAAMAGSRPVVDLMFAEFLALTMTPLGLEGASIAFRTRGAVTAPLVVRAKCGIGPHRGHAESCAGMLLSFPGLKVAMPTTPQDAYSLTRAAIRDDNPVVLLEHMSLLHGARAEVDRTVEVPLGAAVVRREGADLTIAGSGLMVQRALRAAAELARDGLEAEVVDLRSLAPLDAGLVRRSAERTGALLVVEESWPGSGPAAALCAALLQDATVPLGFAVRLLQPPPTPVPFAASLEAAFVPSVADIAGAARALRLPVKGAVTA